MTLRKQPCFNEGRGCKKRYSGCHSKCKDFKEWRQEKDEDNARKRAYIDEHKKLDDIDYKRQRRKGGK